MIVGKFGPSRFPVICGIRKEKFSFLPNRKYYFVVFILFYFFFYVYFFLDITNLKDLFLLSSSHRLSTIQQQNELLCVRGLE